MEGGAAWAWATAEGCCLVITGFLGCLMFEGGSNFVDLLKQTTRLSSSSGVSCSLDWLYLLFILPSPPG